MTRHRATALLVASLLVSPTAAAAGAGSDATATARIPPEVRAWEPGLSIVPFEALVAEKARSAVLPTTAAAPSVVRALAPEETQQFDAIPRLGDISPADPHGAKGIDSVVTVVNVHYAVWTPSGTALVGPARLSDLFSGLVPAGTRLFDPKVVYDPKAGRFYLVVMGLSGSDPDPPASHILVASFSDAEATSPLLWCKVRLPGDPVRGDGNLIADYPGVGFDARRLYVSTNQFTPREFFRYAQVLAIDRADLGSGCGRRPDFRKFWNLREPDGRRAFTIQPAVSIGSLRASAGYAMSFDWRCFPCRGSEITVWRWSRRSGRLRLATRTLRVGRARIAPLGRQQGGGGLDARWDTGDLRLVTAFFDTDRARLYGAHSVARDLRRDGATESVVRWYEVRTPRRLRASEVTRRGIVGAAGTDAGWPAVATNARGRVFVTYSRAAEDEFLSAWVAAIAKRGTGAQPLLLRRGNARYEATPAFTSSGVERWGDYNAVTRDPIAALRMWTVNQYAKDDRDSRNGVRSELWQQVVNAVRP